MRHITAVLLLSVCVSAQTSRTLGQCNADLAAWKSDNTAGVLYPQLTVKELYVRFSELESCGQNYSTASDRGNWSFQADLYGNAMAIRAFSFLHRHKLWDQFLSDDASGER